jgi:hypothetical protein
MLHGDRKQLQFRIGFGHVEYEACIQTAGPESL